MDLSGSVGEWRRNNPRWMSRDSLSSSSSSRRRSSLTSQENSITEEDEVFEDGRDDDQDKDTHEENDDEVEIITGSGKLGQTKVLEWSTTLGSLDHGDVSGVEPLGTTVSSEEALDQGEASVSGVFDTFSDDTAEESLATDDDHGEEQALGVEDVKRRILQDSTLMSSSSNNLETEEDLEEVTHHAAVSAPHVSLPQLLITDGTSHEINVDDVDMEIPEEIPTSPDSVYVTAPSSRRHTSLGSISPTFDTTADEMALFEMFGENYDDIVAAMSHKERVELAAQISNRSEEEMQEVANKLKRIMNDSRRSSVASTVGSEVKKTRLSSVEGSLLSPGSIGSTVSPFSLGSTLTTTPSPLTNPAEPGAEDTGSDAKISSPNTPELSNSAANESKDSSFDPDPEKSLIALSKSVQDSNHLTNAIFSYPSCSPEIYQEERVEQEEGVMVRPGSIQETLTPSKTFPNNFMLPTTSSLNKRTPASPNPRKNPVWMPPSPSPSKLSIGKFISHNAKSPHSSATKSTISRLPQLIRTPQPRPAQSVLAEVGANVLRTPSSVQKKAPGLKNAYSAVASPVATYIKNNPTPNLVQ